MVTAFGIELSWPFTRKRQAENEEALLEAIKKAEEAAMASVAQLKGLTSPVRESGIPRVPGMPDGNRPTTAAAPAASAASSPTATTAPGVLLAADEAAEQAESLLKPAARPQASPPVANSPAKPPAATAVETLPDAPKEKDLLKEEPPKEEGGSGDALSDIFSDLKKKEETPIDRLIASIPDIKPEDLLREAEGVKALMHQWAYTHTGEET